MKQKFSAITTLSAAAVALLIGGCASSTNRPVEQLSRAETAIDLAEQNGAREYGTVALDRARTRLNQAQRAADQGNNEVARRLAHEAALDAELAAAQANRGKAEDSLAEINDSIQTLQREISRNTSQ